MTEQPEMCDSTKRILEAVRDMHRREQIITRESLRDATDLPLTTIDDRLKCLVDDGLIIRVQRGVFVPAEKYREPRIISQTLLPGGHVSIEIGDDHVLQLTPKEYRMLGMLTSGAANEYARIEASNEAAVLAATLAVQVKQMKRQLKALAARRLSGEAQLDIALDGS